MRYFENFPTTTYTFDGRQQYIFVHLLRRFSIQKLVKDNVRVYQEYHIADGDTPDLLANRWYDDSYKYWIILLFNDIIDPFEGWPMSQDNVVKYCQDKYADINATHHYENDAGIVVTPSLYFNGPTYAISNLAYETMRNDAKRRIRIPQKEHAVAIDKEAEQILLTA